MSVRIGYLAAWLCVVVAPAAWAQEEGTPDAGAPDAGGPWRPPPPPSLDGGTSTLEFPTELMGGSEVAAGLDPALAGEVIHPTNLAAVAASLRSLGAPFESGSTSVAVQFNPYLIFKGTGLLYEQYVEARANPLERLLQDMALTVATAPGAPYRGVNLGEGRFGTVAAGLSMELLGERSVYGTAFQRCFDAVPLSAEVVEKKTSCPVARSTPFPGESEEAARLRHAQEQELLRACNQEVEQLITRGIEQCTKQTQGSTLGLYTSLGGRWVVPARKAEQGDGLAVQRTFAALTFEWRTAPGFELAAQGRSLFERLTPAARMSKWLDAGAAVSWTGQPGALRLEYVRSFFALDELTVDNRVVLTLSGRLRIKDEWSLGVSLQGAGVDEQGALDALTLGVVLSFQDLPQFRRQFDL